MIMLSLMLLGIVLALSAIEFTLIAKQDNRINNWTFIIDSLYKTGYKPKTISNILDYYTI